jgi:flavin reductase (DIM6/NTAB) family NADH-FMN oxidoreductase RutF/rubredoxin
MGSTMFDPKALYQIGYGLYVLTTKDGEKDNGCIVNTVMQVTSSPTIIAIGVNKQNYTCGLIQKTGVLNINSLTEDTPFEVFQHFGYRSGRNTDKFAGCVSKRSGNGLIVLPIHVKGFLSLAVKREMDLGSHILFLCVPTEGKLLSDAEAVTYSYYQKHIKPQPQTETKQGFVCRICGHIYEGEFLPENYVCPICKHGAVDFEPLQ